MITTTLYLPSGLRRVESYSAAIEIIKAETKATKIHRWSDQSYNYEDFQDQEGNTVAQIQTTGYPCMLSSFQYV